ncbi:MAG TPA: hypothetical protein VNC60_03795 [Actinomycetota bacterium]|nr:hypothetical protein [Actinomycetota bacterium]
MRVFRRKRLPEELAPAHAAFEAVLAEIEPAKQALTEVMPTTRLPGRPLPDALGEFEDRLGRARALMPSWRRRETEPSWIACSAGIDEALVRAERLRKDAPDLGGFEGLIWAVEQLLDPLGPFLAAADRFRALRVVSRG